MTIDDASRRILQRLIIARNQAQSALKQAENNLAGAEIDCANYIRQICEARGLDPNTHGITQDLASIVPREKENVPE